MDITKIKNLIDVYQKYAGGIVDYQKHAYYAIAHHFTPIVFKQDRIKYINALKKTRKNDNIKLFLAFMCA